MRKHIETYSKVYNAMSQSEFYGNYTMEQNCFNRDPLVFYHFVLLHGNPVTWPIYLS